MKQYIKIIGIILLLSTTSIMSMDADKKYNADVNQAIAESLRDQLEREDLDKAIAASLKTLKIGPKADADTKQLVENKSAVKPTDVCPICMDEAKKFGPGQIFITQCCKKFICKANFQELEKTANKLWADITNQVWRDAYIQTAEYAERGFPQPRGPMAECPLCKTYPVKIKEASVKK